MRSLHLLVVAALAAVSATLTAQTVAHERALPKIATGAFGNSNAAYDPVRDGTRLHQTWFRGDNLPNKYVIVSIGERVNQGVNNQNAVMTYRLKIVLDNSTVKFATMSSVPANNLSKNATTVFDASVNFKARGPSTDPNEVHSWSALKAPWVFTGPNLMLEKTWTPAMNSTGRRYHDVINSPANGIRSRTAGKTCGGTLAATYASPTFTWTITNATANGMAWFMFASENVRMGTRRLPMSLTPLGLTNCELGVVPLITIQVKADAAGMAKLSAGHTPSMTSSGFWSVQGVHQSTANRAGVVTTNVINTISGTVGLVRQLRVDNRGTNGPTVRNASGPMILVRGA